MGSNGRTSRRKNLRSVAFIVLGIFAMLVFGVMFGGVFAALAIFGSAGDGPGYDFPESHRWHDIQWAAHTGILLVGSIAALLRRPQSKPVLMQFVVGATVVVGIVTLLLGHPEYLLWPLLALGLAALYGDRSSLMKLFGSRRNLGIASAVLAIAVVVALLPEAINKLDLQRANAAGDEHAEFLHWSMGLLLAIQYGLAGLLMATNRPGSRDLAIVTGLSLSFLGLGAVVLQNADGVAATWSMTGGLLATMAGIGFVAIGVLGDRISLRASRPTAMPSGRA